VDLKRPPSPGSLRFLRRGVGEQVRRSRRRRARRVALFAAACFALGLLGGAAYAGRYYVTHAPRFRLRRIEFSATRHAPEAELRRLLGRHLGANLFRIDLHRIESDLEGRRWVKRARVKRLIPDGVYCALEEREPRGLALLGDRVWLVDDEGVAIDPYGEQEARRYSFPILVGADVRNPARAREQIGRGVRLLAYLSETHAGLLPEIGEVDVSRDDRLDLRLEEGGPIVRLHPKDYSVNLMRYLTLRDYLTTHFGDGAYIDLRFRDRITFRPLLVKGG